MTLTASMLMIMYKILNRRWYFLCIYSLLKCVDHRASLSRLTLFTEGLFSQSLAGVKGLDCLKVRCGNINNIRLDYLLVPITAELEGDMCTKGIMYMLLNTGFIMATGSSYNRL